MLKVRRKPTQFEAQAQRALFEILSIKYPKIREVTFAIPNGGYRTPIEAKCLQLEGVTAGVPDIFVAIPKSDFHGLFIEMKKAPGIGSPRGRISEAQKVMILKLREQGYLVSVCYGAQEALDAIETYVAREDW